MVYSPGWSVNARFPDGTVERVPVHEKPEVGVLFLARGAQWRITEMRMPKTADDVHEVDVEPVDE
jgi:hypothetical protein